ncbi:hypothetical protein M3Y97_00690300 [Aphelenchoides bicaudatus]|nr:hypothetical protein M3Y97_00690300 [Aphelenchoides bicaudatus]
MTKKTSISQRTVILVILTRCITLPTKRSRSMRPTNRNVMSKRTSMERKMKATTSISQKTAKLVTPKRLDSTSLTRPKNSTKRRGRRDKKDFDGASSKPKRDTAKAGQHFDDKKDFAEEKNFDQPGRHTRDTAKAGQHFDDMKKPSFNDEVHKPKRDVEKNFDGMKNEGHHFDQPKDRHTRDTDKMHHFTDEKKPFDGASSKPKRDTSKAGQHFDDMKKPSFDGMKDSHH